MYNYLTSSWNCPKEMNRTCHKIEHFKLRPLHYKGHFNLSSKKRLVRKNQPFHINGQNIITCPLAQPNKSIEYREMFTKGESSWIHCLSQLIREHHYHNEAKLQWLTILRDRWQQLLQKEKNYWKGDRESKKLCVFIMKIKLLKRVFRKSFISVSFNINLLISSSLLSFFPLCLRSRSWLSIFL